MIVKNESHVILRVLNSVSPIIDYWVIVDTGSTDGTQEIVKKFFEEKNIPGELIEIEWKDFATSRNVALDAVEPHVDYGIWIDADEELIIDKTFDKKKTLTAGVDSISLKTIYGKVDYTRKNIWKTGMNFRWNGPIHELLASKDEKTGDLAQGLAVIVRPEGSSWNNIKEKYLSHAKILEEYTKENPDPRWIFYTAQSYRDASEYAKSIEWYKKRAEIKEGFYEEIYISKLMIAKLSEALGKDKHECQKLYQEANSVDPIRGEAIKGLVQMFQRLKDWETAYVFSLYGLRYNRNNPYPHRILFLDKTLYDYEMLELHALSCFWTKRIDEGSRAYWLLRAQIQELGEGYLSPQQMKVIMENEQYYPKPSAMPVQNAPVNLPRRGGTNFTKPKKRRKKK
jgi:glycosyltransferase involved in cell wall biosynthesis